MVLDGTVELEAGSVELGFDINLLRNSFFTSEVEITLESLFLSMTLNELKKVLPP